MVSVAIELAANSRPVKSRDVKAEQRVALAPIVARVNAEQAADETFHHNGCFLLPSTNAPIESMTRAPLGVSRSDWLT